MHDLSLRPELADALGAIAADLGCSEDAALERAVGLLMIVSEHMRAPAASVALRQPRQLDRYIEPGLLRRSTTDPGST